MNFYGQEQPENLTRSRDRNGKKNSRVAAAKREKTRSLSLADEFKDQVRRLTPAEIAAQYPPERVEALLQRGQQNLRRMTRMRIEPYWIAVQKSVEATE